MELTLNNPNIMRAGECTSRVQNTFRGSEDALVLTNAVVSEPVRGEVGCVSWLELCWHWGGEGGMDGVVFSSGCPCCLWGGGVF